MAEKPELAPKYYLEYFNYLLDFVQEKYKNILNHEEWKFLRKYYCLSEDAQCLFIRFTNRKGLFFKTDSIRYQELSNIPEVIEDLKKREFIEALDPQKHQLHLKDIIGILTKADLISIFGLNAFKNLKREALNDLVMEKFEPEDIIETIAEQVAVVKVNFEFEVAFLRYLFFGNRSMDMTEFVVRDLGFVQYYGHNDDQLVARFNTRKDADDKWLITDQHEIFSTLKDELEPPALFDWFLTLNDSIKDLSEIALPGYERLILKIGQHFERKKHYELAIETFEFTSIAPSRERRVRCFQKLGKMEEALAICQTMLQTYQNADERFFAEDFIRIQSEKKTRNKKSTTTWLHLSDEIEIDGMYRHQVEAGTMQYYLDEGHNAAFSENHLWRAIFGLMFWEIIFDPSIVSFHHPFQRRPSDLHLPDFYEKTKSQIQQQLNRFEETEDLIEYLQANYHKNMGIANPFVVWLDEIWVMVEAAVTKLGITRLRLILERIAENIVENSRGLPDLFIWSEYHYEFVEVKSPTDNLSNQQLYWLRYFKEIGVNAKVLRVKFRKD